MDALKAAAIRIPARATTGCRPSRVLALLCGLALAGPLAPAQAAEADQPSVAVDMRMADAAPDETVLIRGAQFPKDRQQIKVLWNNSDKQIFFPEAVEPDSLTLKVPRDVKPGRYLITLSVESTGRPALRLPVPGELRVISKLAPKIESISPITSYPALNARHNFSIIGDHFSAQLSDNVIEIGGNTLPGTAYENKHGCKASGDSKILVELPCVAMEGSRKLLVFGYQPGSQEGPVKVRVRVGEQISDPVNMTLSRIGAHEALLLALLCATLLTLTVITLVWRGVGRAHIDGETYHPLSVFFLDKATNSYSLSKAQLFAWTAATVFGYCYLTIANLFIQWKFTLPPIPEGLPTLLGLSAGTTVAAMAITDNISSKGGGPARPSMADFITSGGLVAAERFQFFVWTIVGVAGFLSMLIFADPATITELPRLPDNFIYLMGISSVAYLGGKAVRKPGPVIRTLSINAITPAGKAVPSPAPDRHEVHGEVWTIALKGDNLSANPTLRIDDKVLRPEAQFWVTPGQVTTPGAVGIGELGVHLDQAAIDPVLDKPLAEGTHTLTLLNADGQSAAATFPVDSMVISNAPLQVARSSTPVSDQLKGDNFCGKLRVQWRAPGASAPVDIPASDVVVSSPNAVTVKFTPGTTPGAGMLTLISALGLRTSAVVTVA